VHHEQLGVELPRKGDTILDGSLRWLAVIAGNENPVERKHNASLTQPNDSPSRPSRPAPLAPPALVYPPSISPPGQKMSYARLTDGANDALFAQLASRYGTSRYPFGLSATL